MAAEGARQPGSSKYDFVKVRVRLSERHYYVLSRFLVSRVLSATKVIRKRISSADPPMERGERARIERERARERARKEGRN